MASQYKLTYFDITGLGESIRLLFHYGGINFVDQRVDYIKDWPALKSKTPLGQLPTLEIDGQVLHQSTAISRYVANLVGLTGKNPLENWEIDAVVDTITDLRDKVFDWAYAPNDDGAAKAKKKVGLDVDLPFLMSKLEAWATKNDGYLATGKLTWADLYFAGNIDYLVFIYGRNFLADYPNLTKVRENVVSIPRIKEWIDVRPKDRMY